MHHRGVICVMLHCVGKVKDVQPLPIGKISSVEIYSKKLCLLHSLANVRNWLLSLYCPITRFYMAGMFMLMFFHMIWACSSTTFFGHAWKIKEAGRFNVHYCGKLFIFVANLTLLSNCSLPSISHYWTASSFPYTWQCSTISVQGWLHSKDNSIQQLHVQWPIYTPLLCPISCMVWVVEGYHYQFVCTFRFPKCNQPALW